MSRPDASTVEVLDVAAGAIRGSLRHLQLLDPGDPRHAQACWMAGAAYGLYLAQCQAAGVAPAPDLLAALGISDGVQQALRAFRTVPPPTTAAGGRGRWGRWWRLACWQRPADTFAGVCAQALALGVAGALVAVAAVQLLTVMFDLLAGGGGW